MLLKRSGMPVGSTGVVSAVRARSKTIALNVVGKPNKVRVSKHSIKSVTKDNGSTLLFLIGRNEPLMLRDSAEEVENKVRHGQYGKEFNMLKFRSMRVGSDYLDQQVTHDDSRVTLIGRIIRKTSFDEIPQLLNVLRGEMSLVGPRPHILSETNRYSKEIISFLSRHQVKPGLTGLAQIRTRGKTNSLELMQHKLESDLEYINEWSIYLDLKILIKTPLSIWNNRNTNV